MASKRTARRRSRPIMLPIASPPRAHPSHETGTLTRGRRCRMGGESRPHEDRDLLGV